MSWIERSIEERLANAVAAGELDTPHLHGRALDLETQRAQGWWADQFARRELSHDRRARADAAAATARVGFWRSSTASELRAAVATANEAIDHANLNLVAEDRLEPFDVAEIERRWRDLRR